MAYLKKEIKRPKIPVTEAMKNLKLRFSRDTPDIVRDQIPLDTSSLAEDLSLHDPTDRFFIGGTYYNELFETIYNKWRTLPSKRTYSFDWNGSPVSVVADFTRLDECFLNALKIELNLSGNLELLTFLPTVQPSCLQVLKVEQETRRCVLVIHKLQAMTDDDQDAVVSFNVVGSPSNEPVITINLGRPLISSHVVEPANDEPLNQL